MPEAMMPTPAPTPAGNNHAPGWRPSRRALLIAGIAFALGLLAFMTVWMNQRDDGFYRAAAPTQGVEGQRFEPLPAPMPAGDAANASGMGAPDEQADGAANRIEEPPQSASPPPPAPSPPSTPAQATAASTTPVPIESPAPRYPPDALRHGESGTVLLRIHVDPNGVPIAVDLVRSSRSRSLDHAASEAVMRWRFRPAQRDGQPVNGEVQIPISFNADR